MPSFAFPFAGIWRRFRSLFVRSTGANPNAAAGVSPSLIAHDFLGANTTREFEVIQRVDRAILSSSTSASDPLKIIVNEGRSLTGAKHSHVVLVKRDHLLVEASSGGLEVGSELAMNRSLCGAALEQQKDQHVSDVEAFERMGHYHRAHSSTRSELAILIQPVGSSRILGILDIERDEIGSFSQEAQTAARMLAGQAAIAIEKSRSSKCLEALNKVSTELLQGDLTTGLAYDGILAAALEALSFEHGQVLMLDGDEMIIVASSRPSDLGLRVNSSNSVCGHYIISEGGNHILNIPNIAEGSYSPFYLPLLKANGERPMRSEMILPLMDGLRVVGALNIESPQLNAFSDADKEMLGLFGGLIQRTAVATLSVSNRATRDRIASEQRAMTRLGLGAVDFLHQFRNEVGHLRGNLVFLRDHLGPAGEQMIDTKTSTYNFVNQMVGETEAIREIIRDYSSRFDPRLSHYQPSQEDLVAVSERAIKRFRGRHPNEADDIISVEVKLPEAFRGEQVVRAKSICVVTPQINDVLADLLDNALRAISDKRATSGETYKGEIRITIDLPEPLSLRLSIFDNGIGIPKDDVEKVFEHSFSTKEKGSGLGLWMCKSYMYQQGGSVSVESEPGQFTKFKLTFPLALNAPITRTMELA